jgi:hypothetical protein
MGSQDKSLLPEEAIHGSLVVGVITSMSSRLIWRVDTSKPDISARSMICLETVIDKDRVVALACLHFFHSKCFDRMCASGITRCPLCQRSLFTMQENGLKSGQRGFLTRLLLS